MKCNSVEYNFNYKYIALNVMFLESFTWEGDYKVTFWGYLFFSIDSQWKWTLGKDLVKTI